MASSAHSHPQSASPVPHVAPGDSSPELPSRGARGWGHPLTHLFILAGIAVYYLAISWRRWPDAVVDFGRELYIPWQLAQGAVLYRDVDDFYGPLSQYFNAALFHLFGPGLMVLVTANLVVFAAIVVTVYFLVRRAWGGVAALGSMAVFVAVFGFSRFRLVGNYNYATPYAHETTHGLLVLVLLAAVLLRWVERPGKGNSALAGLLFGLTLVLKPEIIFAAVLMLAVALIWRRREAAPWPSSGRAWAIGAALFPTAGFGVYLASELGPVQGWAGAARAWLSVMATTRFTSDPVQAKYAGLDQPGLRLLENGVAIGMALAVVAAVILVGRWVEKRRGTRKALVGGVLAVAVFAAGSALTPSTAWLECGRSLLGLFLIYLGWVVLRRARGGADPADEKSRRARAMMTVLAVALLARMALAGKIYQFGYYQAALAGVVVVAVLLGELPGRVARSALARVMVVSSGIAILLPGVVALTRASRSMYQQLTVPMGAGRDRFFTFEVVRPIAEIAAQLGTVSSTGTLLVLPEGLMLNYLPRLRSPLAPFFFFSAATADGREKELVAKLSQQPPDWVILLPRDLREYGVQVYGERSGAGKDLMQWVAANCEGAPGDTTPIVYRTDVIQVLRRKPGYPAGVR